MTAPGRRRPVTPRVAAAAARPPVVPETRSANLSIRPPRLPAPCRKSINRPARHELC